MENNTVTITANNRPISFSNMLDRTTSGGHRYYVQRSRGVNTAYTIWLPILAKKPKIHALVPRNLYAQEDRKLIDAIIEEFDGFPLPTTKHIVFDEIYPIYDRDGHLVKVETTRIVAAVSQNIVAELFQKVNAFKDSGQLSMLHLLFGQTFTTSTTQCPVFKIRTPRGLLDKFGSPDHRQAILDIIEVVGFMDMDHVNVEEDPEVKRASHLVEEVKRAQRGDSKILRSQSRLTSGKFHWRKIYTDIFEFLIGHIDQTTEKE